MLRQSMARAIAALTAWCMVLGGAAPAAAQGTAAVAGGGGHGGAGWRQEPTLTVTGAGEVRVVPDRATVRLGTQAQAPSAREAQDQVSRTTAAILAAVKKLGVPAESIQTSELSLAPLYSQGRGNGEQRVTGYQAGNVVSILLDRMERVGPVVDAGLAAGANRLEGVAFGLRNDTAARAAALAEAVGQARRKAEALAAALRVKLVEVAEVVEQGAEPVVPRYGGVRAMAMAAVAQTPVSPGEVAVNAGVVVRYRIAPCPAQGPCDGAP